jgi:hypothetical protein
MGKRVRCSGCRRTFVASDDDDAEVIEMSARRAPAKNAAPSAVSGCAGCVVLVFFVTVMGVLIGAVVRQRSEAALEDGKKLWDAGQRDEAAPKLEQGYSAASPVEKTEVAQRLIDYYLDKENPQTAQHWVEQAVQDWADGGLEVRCKNPAVVTLLQRARAERDARVARERAEAGRQQAEAEQRAKAEQERAAKEARWGSDGEAALEARRVVKQQLAFPAEARFNFFAVRDPERVQNGDGSWTIWGGVTSKNGFGVKVKFQWRVDLVRLADGAWNVLGVDLTPDTD